MRQMKSLLNVFLATSVGCIALACFAALEGKAEIEIEVSLKERYLWLKDSGNVIKKYPIAHLFINESLKRIFEFRIWSFCGNPCIICGK